MGKKQHIEIEKSDDLFHLIDMKPGSVLHINGGPAGAEASVVIRVVDETLEVIADGAVFLLRRA